MKYSANDFVFKEKNGGLEFIGDFNSLYKYIDDPWYQSCQTKEPIKHYYKFSRDRLITQLKNINPKTVLEIGCGLGYVSENIQSSLNCDVLGMDVSEVAISRATDNFPNLIFKQGDIKSENFIVEKKFDLVILSQLLWYVLDSISNVFENCFSLLKSNGKVVITQAFLTSEQIYGADICDGFDGLIDYLNRVDINNMFQIEYENYDDSNSYVHNDGLIILRRV
jgi:SAM-dependent methyltransferase